MQEINLSLKLFTQRMCLALHYAKEREVQKYNSFYNNSVLLYSSLDRHINKKYVLNVHLIKFK